VGKLDEIAGAQRDLLSETQKLESERLSKRMEEQEKWLVVLAKRQAAVIERTTTVVGDKKTHPSVAATLAPQGGPMQTVYEELTNKRVQKSVSMLEAIVAQVGATEDSLTRSSASVSGLSDLSWIRSEENDILQKLKKPDLPEPPATDDQKKQFSKLSERQKDLQRKTQSVRKEIQTLSRKSAGLSMAVTQPLSMAADAMDGSSQQLNNNNGRSAQGNQEEALSNLDAARGALGEAQSAMSAAGPGGSGGPGSGGMPQAVVRQSGGSGRGTKTGRVRLPTVDDYKPPKAFREELLESLKEKYPKIYEDIIHTYYKRLTE
jgi:hypothetical protein